jgi:uncharacterized membrane protein YhhN
VRYGIATRSKPGSDAPEIFEVCVLQPVNPHVHILNQEWGIDNVSASNLTIFLMGSAMPWNYTAATTRRNMENAMPIAVGFAVVAAISGLLAIYADWNERRHFTFYVLKPLTTLFIIGIAATVPQGDARTLMLLALVLSLAGDICLMFEGQGWFIGGLSSFLLAHLAFIPALLHGVDSPSLPLWSAGIVVWGLGFFAWLLPKTGVLKPAVLIYGTVLMAMALAAVARWNVAPTEAARYALIGALLFVVSDSSLAIRKFVGPYHGAQAVILSTYWSAIGLMAYSLTAASGLL